MTTQLTERDHVVLATVQELRAKHGACTAAAVAVTMRISKAYLHDVMYDMIERGLLQFSPEMVGSLRLTTKAELALGVLHGHTCDRCGWPDANALRMHQRKHAQS